MTASSQAGTASEAMLGAFLEGRRIGGLHAIPSTSPMSALETARNRANARHKRIAVDGGVTIKILSEMTSYRKCISARSLELTTTFSLIYISAKRLSGR